MSLVLKMETDGRCSLWSWAFHGNKDCIVLVEIPGDDFYYPDMWVGVSDTYPL